MRMLNNSQNCALLRCRIYKYLFLLFLVIFAISPIVDAFSDSLCSSSVFFNDLNDSNSPVSINDLNLNDACESLQAQNRASKQNHDIRALLLRDMAINGLSGSSTRSQLRAYDRCSSQQCSLVSSDPSPPII